MSSTKRGGRRSINIDYQPTPKQQMFHTTDADEVLYGGAAGGGKSKAIVMDALARCLQYPGTSAYIFRRTYRELEDTIIKEAISSYPKEIAPYNTTRHECALPNGSKIIFRHCASVMNMYDYSGAEIQWLYFDELTTFEKEIYDFLKTRLRAKKSLGVKPIVRSASNPGNIGHGWVKAMFVDAGEFLKPITHEVDSVTLQKKVISTTQYIPSLATENPHITEDYILELEKKPPALKRALLNGEWDAFEGQVFTEFKNDPDHYRDRKYTHVIAPFEIPRHWARYMSFDFGYKEPFSCGWWAVAPDGRVYRYREWYGWDGHPDTGVQFSPRQIADGIIEREREFEMAEGINITRVADPSIFDKSRGASIAEQMEPQANIPGVFFEPADNARIAGKMQLHERLRFDSHGYPGLYVFTTCDQFIRTVPTLPYNLGKGKCEDVDTDAEDHIYDDARYFLMARPLPIKRPVAPKERRYTPFNDYDDGYDTRPIGER